MSSRLIRSPDRVRCVVCARTVVAREARMMDLCGPVYVCSRCPNLYATWPGCLEMPVRGTALQGGEGAMPGRDD